MRFVQESFLGSCFFVCWGVVQEIIAVVPEIRREVQKITAGVQEITCGFQDIWQAVSEIMSLYLLTFKKIRCKNLEHFSQTQTPPPPKFSPIPTYPLPSFQIRNIRQL